MKGSTDWSIRDPEIDAYLIELEEDGCPDVVGLYICRNLGHRAVWSGTNAYVHRVRSGLSRAQVRDGLLKRGVDATSNLVYQLEHTEERGVDLLHARALASVLGVEIGALLNCGACSYAALSKSTPPADLADVCDPRAPVPAAIRRWAETGGSRYRAARLAAGMSVRATARAAGVRARDVVRLERGEWSRVGCNVPPRVAGVLNVDFYGRPCRAVDNVG